MIDSTIQNDLLQEVERLLPSLQRRVVDFAHALAESMPQNLASYTKEYVDNLDPHTAQTVKDDIEAGYGWTDPAGAAKSMIDWIYSKP
jgi:hypothetical protein